MNVADCVVFCLLWWCVLISCFCFVLVVGCIWLHWVWLWLFTLLVGLCGWLCVVCFGVSVVSWFVVLFCDLGVWLRLLLIVL